MTNPNTTDATDQEATEFLERDFNQCFAQMRHYDTQIWDICKFTFTSYTVLVSVAIGLYKYSLEKQLDLVPASIAALSIGVLLGTFMFFLTIRNRVYFVFVARYINEHRRLFLNRKPLGFENVSKMYINPNLPRFLDWRSSEVWLSFVIAVLNSVMLATLVFMAADVNHTPWLFALFVSVIFLAIQLIIGSWHLHSREGKSSSRAVFGTDGGNNGPTLSS